MDLNGFDAFRRGEPILALAGKQSTNGFAVYRRAEPVVALVVEEPGPAVVMWITTL